MSAQTLPLAPVLDLRAAAPLLEAIRARRGAPLALDGAEVERVGAQCLQVILAAQAAWAADGHDFEIVNSSTGLKDGWVLMGADALLQAAPAETAR